MHYLLHLSDLHLSAVDERDVTGDYKRRVIPLADRQRRRRTLEATLRSLGEWLRDRDSDLDAIVVTGDVTYQNQLDGFELLGETLGCLGDRLPGSSRILVVPGNHDVRWETDPGTPERYERYLAHVRRKGYVTPLLEGIDLGEGGERLAGTADPVLIATDASFVVVALNSSNYCGVVEGLEILDEKDLERVKGMAQRDPVLGRLQKDDPTTGRALISFFDPRFDLITDRSIKFPSFCTLQFVID